MPAYFRFLTILAFHVFLQEEVRPPAEHSDTANGAPKNTLSVLQVDVAVIEVGIGGAYDCTNIIR